MALKNDLLDSEKNRYSSGDSNKKTIFTENTGGIQPTEQFIPESKVGRGIKKVLFVGFVLMFGIYIFSKITFSAPDVSGIADAVTNEIINTATAPDEKLLSNMGDWMERMGYGKLSTEELTELRKKGVTATFTSKIRELGYEPTLEQMKQLAQHDVSATFASMIHALGYKSITLEEMMRLRINGVTAHYTSNVHDLGYTSITIEDLIRLKNAEVSISMIKKLNEGRVQPASIDELVRYGISNQ